MPIGKISPDPTDSLLTILQFLFQRRNGDSRTWSTMVMLTLEAFNLWVKLANGYISGTMDDHVQLNFNSGVATHAGAEIASGSLWISHSCLKRLERRDSSEAFSS